MTTLTKEYTRAFTLIMGQVWLYGFMRINEAMSAKIPVAYVEYRLDGSNQYWEAPDALQTFSELLLAQNMAGRDFYDGFIRDYKKSQQLLLKYPRGTAPTSIQEFNEVLEVIIAGVAGWCVMYYSPLDARTPADIKTEAEVLRATDALGDDADEFIRSSLRKFFPHLGGLETAIAFRELEAQPDIAVLKKRENGSVVYADGDKLIVTDETTDEFEAKHPEYHFVRETAPIDARQVEGQTAYKGTVRGTARVLKTRTDIPLLKEGDVLVTYMTTPDFIPAMKRAVALVTDEGGVMCHAAILAREMKKPCVIGTKFATQVFKDGDLVEVDAEMGIVRKI